MKTSERDAEGLRIAVIYPAADPLEKRNWSGAPQGLSRGLAELGADVVPLGASPRAPLRKAVSLASRIDRPIGAALNRTPAVRWRRTALLNKGFRRAGHFDGVVAMGTELYDLQEIGATGIPLATYDDATLSQMNGHPDSDVHRYARSSATVERWSRRQATAARTATRCCVSTSWAADSFVEDYAIPRDGVRVVGIGHDPKSGDPTRRDWRHPRFLFVGLDWERKNGDLTLRAFRRVRTLCPDATLDVVGGHPALSEPGVRGHGVLALGEPQSQRRLLSLFQTATVFVMPSRFEPAGIVYLEAASAGLPVIGTTQGGARFLLDDPALAVDPSDEDGLTAAMLSLTNPEAARRRGQRAAAYAETSRWPDVARSILRGLDLVPPSPSEAPRASTTSATP